MPESAFLDVVQIVAGLIGVAVHGGAGALGNAERELRYRLGHQKATPVNETLTALTRRGSLDQRMLPDFNEETGYLPPGVHYATLEEIKERFGKTVRRSRLVVNLDKVVRQLWDAGVQEVFIDGSFCTATPVPNDIDGYWIYIQGFDRTKVDPVLLQMDIFVFRPPSQPCDSKRPIIPRVLFPEPRRCRPWLRGRDQGRKERHHA